MIIDGKQFKLVPVEPTDEMVDAATGGLIDVDGFFRAADAITAAIAAAPAPPEVVVSDEMAKKVAHYYHHHPVRNSNAADGRDMIDAVQSILGPALGMVELKEPTPEECERIYSFWLSAEGCNGRTPGERMGRIMFDAVRAVMWPKEGL